MANEPINQTPFPRSYDHRRVADFVRAMNIARRNLAAYPRGHSLVIESFEKVRSTLQDFFAYGSHFTLGIAKDALLLAGRELDKKNPVFQSFAQTLFGHGIIAITIFPDVTVDELMDFDHIMTQKRNEVQRQGGVTVLLSKAKIRNIRVQLIDYRMFQAHEGQLDSSGKEGQDSVFWWRFVRGLMDGSLDPHGLSLEDGESVEPEVLASILNEHYIGTDLIPGGSSDHTDERNSEGGHGIPVGRHGAQTNEEGNDSGNPGSAREGSGFAFFVDSKGFDFLQVAYDQESSARLNRFIQSLDPRLRQIFVERFFIAFSNNTNALCDLVPSLSDEIIMEALDNYTRSQCYLPPQILDVLERFRKASAGKDSSESTAFPVGLTKDELVQKLSVIFKEDEVDRFVPLDYQRALRDVVTADSLSASELSQIRQLEETLSSQSVNAHLTSVVVDLVAKREGRDVPPHLMRSLTDCCRYLISVGDFHGVSKIYEAVTASADSSSNRGDATSDPILDAFADEDFVGDVLDGPAQWGKEKDLYIVELIKKIGKPFVEPLLDRLATEEDRTLRYFYLDLLGQLGAIVKEPAVKRLEDQRWFVVRNLIILLRNLNDPSILPSLHRLLDHPHPRVRFELMQTLITFNDPVAERIILQEMESPDLARCLKAIAMAGMSRNRLVSQRLLQFVRQKGFGKTVFPIKKASVQALGEIGDPSVLPTLQMVLRSRSFFRRHAANTLKAEIIESLRKYPPREASPTLKEVAQSSSQALAERALSVMKNIEVTPS